MSVEGDFTPAERVVAIVGARRALRGSLDIAYGLAKMVARNGGVVVSGGANGVDAAAHLGAIDGGGRTWAVLGCGAPMVTPTGDKLDDPERFTRILRSGGCIVRPFPENTAATPTNFLSRNRITVALADLVIVVQAKLKSGSWSTASKTREMKKELWVVPGFGEEFVASWELIRDGAHVMRSPIELERWLKRSPTSFEGDADAELILKALGSHPKHPDQLAAETGLSTPAVTTALLTLALGDVVVEGSAGLFQRK